MKKNHYLINRPMFDEGKLQIGKGITVIKGNNRKDGLISEISPFKLKVLYLNEEGKTQHLDIGPEEVWNSKTIFIFGKK